MTSPVRFIFPGLLTLLLACCASQPAHAIWGGQKKAAQKAGAALFRDKGCAHCHGVAGVGGKKAPSLTGLPKDKNWTPAKITDQILNGGQKMPPFADSLTDEQVAQIVGYLRAKHKPAPPPQTSGSAPVPAAD
ncbi:MAG: cytochrome c [Terracidiphilus sp.]